MNVSQLNCTIWGCHTIRDSHFTREDKATDKDITTDKTHSSSGARAAAEPIIVASSPY